MLDSTVAYDLTFLIPHGDLAVGNSLRFYGEFARSEIDFLVACAKDSAGTFIDVGANLGAIAIPFAHRKPGWRVMGVEAHRGMASLLAANALNNRIFNVDALHAAAGAKAGLAEFPATPLDAKMRFGLLSFEMEGPKETVRMLTLDETAPPDTRIIKVDVEGFEPQVLEGSKRLIEARNAIFFVEAVGKRRDDRTAMIAMFQQAGYATYWFYAPFATPNSPKAKPGNPAVGDVNVAAFPPGVKPPWDLLPIRSPDEAAPTSLAGYPYLARYGYVPEGPAPSA